MLLTANHSTSGANLDPMYNSISAWIEVTAVCKITLWEEKIIRGQRENVFPDVDTIFNQLSPRFERHFLGSLSGRGNRIFLVF